MVVRFTGNGRSKKILRKNKNGERCGSPWKNVILNFRQPLPAAIPATTAISAIAATAPAPTPATSASTTAPASKAAPPAPSASAPTAFARRPGFIHHDIAAHEIMPVEALNGAFRFVIAVDFDETEAAWLARETVAHQGNVRRGDSRLSE
jgi:hypothetical protein